MRDSCVGVGLAMLAFVSFCWACFLASVWRSGYHTGRDGGYSDGRRDVARDAAEILENTKQRYVLTAVAPDLDKLIKTETDGA